jgi:hypothetical protein
MQSVGRMQGLLMSGQVTYSIVTVVPFGFRIILCSLNMIYFFEAVFGIVPKQRTDLANKDRRIYFVNLTDSQLIRCIG